MDFQAQRFEQLPCEFLGELVELDAGDGQGVDQVGVGSGVDASLGGIELGFEFLAVGAEFRAALVDVAQQVGVGVVEEFEAADGALDPLVGFGDGAAQRGDVVVVVAASVGVDGGGCGVEQGAAVGAEDVVGQEVVEAVDQLVFATKNVPPGGCPSGV